MKKNIKKKAAATKVKEKSKYTPEQKKMIQFAREECANWSNKKCLNGYECKLINNVGCNYFNECVFPLLEAMRSNNAKGKGNTK